MDAFKDMLSALAANWQEALIGGVIVVCAIIVFVGVLKKIIFNKISNKLVRKVVLAFTSVVLAMPATALYFVGAQVNFEYYWYASAMVAILTILGYWLYENTGLRNAISYIGTNVVIKYATAIVDILKNKTSASDAVKTIQNTTEDAKQLVNSTTLFPSMTKLEVGGTNSGKVIDDDLKDL